jgi:hypothetical protein
MLLVAALLLEAGPRGLGEAQNRQEPAAVPGRASPRPKLTQDAIDDMRFARYEVERTEVKYQPYIVTYDGQELRQLSYDTLREAQARVDEIKTEDRLDKLGVEGRQHKKVDIRVERRTYTETVSGDGLANLLKNHGVRDRRRYLPSGKTTHCSEFVRDFARELLGRDLPELGGKAGDQYDRLKAAVGSPASKWRSLSFPDDPTAAFRNAQELANEGKLVVIAWKNPRPTKTDSGHVAVVSPSRQDDGGLFDATERKWKMKVPYIAQAGEVVSDYMPLSDGFGPSKKSGMEIFVLTP